MIIEPSYQETLDYLFSYVDFSIQKTFHINPPKFELEQMQTFVTELGNPHMSYPIIHVAGTKGKGSVSALCASSLYAAGYKVGFYISPHLHDYCERIQINGVPISHADLTSLVNQFKPAIENIPKLTTFEITTALAFIYFSTQKVDVAVIEVGLGGRLDATNVVIPNVSVITSLSYDHTFLLGNTLAEIASEKAGIIKSGKPVISSPQKDEARQVLTRIASERSSQFIQVGLDYLYAPLEHSLDGQSFWIWTKSEQKLMDSYIETDEVGGWLPTRLDIPLLGYHQVENAATAYAALQVFRQTGIELSEEAIQNGFTKVSWPGRFEILRREPPIVVDSAHNRDSAQKLRLTLTDYFPNRPVVLIFGASEDKDIQGMLTELVPGVRKVVATKATHPRAMEPENLVKMVHQCGRPCISVPQVPEALDTALKIAGDECITLAAGSIFLAAETRQAWLERKSTKGSSK